MRWMEKYNKCINNPFSLILHLSLIVNEKFLLNAYKYNPAGRLNRETNYYTIKKEININKHKIELSEHVLESNIKHMLIIIFASSIILKFLIGV